MGRFFKKEFRKKMPISTPGFAAGITGMARALEEMEIIGGHIEWSARNVPKLIVSEGGGSPASDLTPKPFDIAFSGAEFTLSNCTYRRMEITQTYSDINGEVTQDGDWYIAAWINSDTGACMAQVGASIADVTDAASNPESDYYKILLYKVTRSTDEEENVSVTVTTNYRDMPFVGLYV